VVHILNQIENHSNCRPCARDEDSCSTTPRPRHDHATTWGGRFIDEEGGREEAGIRERKALRRRERRRGWGHGGGDSMHSQRFCVTLWHIACGFRAECHNYPSILRHIPHTNPPLYCGVIDEIPGTRRPSAHALEIGRRRSVTGRGGRRERWRWRGQRQPSCFCSLATLRPAVPCECE
jgi:hypothetical protein